MSSLSLKMVLRRSSLNCRLKTRVAFISLLLIFISITFLYRALMSEHGHESYQRSFPTMEKKRPIRFHSKHVEQSLNNMQAGGLRDAPEIYVGAAVKDRDLLSADSRKALSLFLTRLYPTNWVTATETDDMALELKYLLLDYGFESKMSCKDIDSLHVGHAVTYTRTKFIEYGFFESSESDNNYNRNYYDGYNTYKRRRSSNMAVKSPSNDIETKIECMKQIYDSELCSTMGNYRFLREVLLMVTLHHPSIPILKGYCLRGMAISSTLHEKGLILVTEVGTPLTQSLIDSCSWRQRTSYALQISELLNYLDTSPVGSLRVAKIQLKDFVVVNSDTVKLVDLDDLQLDERRCSSSTDCLLADGHNGVVCSRGVCDGFNSLFNLDLVSKQVLLPLLFRSPGVQTEKLVEKLQRLDTNIADVVSKLHIIYQKMPPDPAPRINNPPAVNEALSWKDHINSVGRQEFQGNNNNGNFGRQEFQGNNNNDNNNDNFVDRMHAINQAGLPDISRNADASQFIRKDMKNFPGIYDYPCEGSRVSWGCVFTVTSLNKAIALCKKDPACKAFITFSTQPEAENLMTVLLKNATDDYPQTSSGTTLFIKSSIDGGRAHDSVEITNVKSKREEEEDKDDDDDDDDDELDDTIDLEMTVIHDCAERSIQMLQSARHSREKRLMTHLGLKGIREQTWRRAALEERLGNLSRIIKAEGGGGKFQVNLEGRREMDKVPTTSKATFVAEDGPKNYHLAYALVYHLDRILGFYHTPSCIGRKLTPSILEPFHTSSGWEETFQPLIESDGTLTGIMMITVPRVMKLSKVTLQPRDVMTPEIVAFERPDKLQLEYMVLSWLAGIETPSSDHLGFKGHLIHFNADQAFRNTSVNYSGYLNHCQFPNVAYKALLCFQCKSDPIGTTVCHLGQEAATRLRSMFDEEVELNFHQTNERHLMESIDGVASHMMLKVDQCIKRFGRENVLY